MAPTRAGACGTLVTMCALTIVIASPSRAQDQSEPRSFVQRIAGMIFEAAWPSAFFQEANIRSITPAAGGFDVNVRFAGTSRWGRGPLRLDLALMLRNGSLYDLRVTGHNAVLAEPFSTARAIAKLIADVGESYAENAARPRAYVPPPRESYTLQIANDCHLPISVWLRYQDPSGQWITNGRWDLPGQTSSGLSLGAADTSPPLRVRSRVVYSYAAPTLPDARISWYGDYEVRFGETLLRMMADTLRDDGSGKLTLSRNCANIRRLGVRGENAQAYEFEGRTYTQGARVTDVEQGYLGERLGILPGDVIYHVNDQAVDGWEPLVRHIIWSTGKPLVMYAIRSGQRIRFESPADAGR